MAERKYILLGAVLLALLAAALGIANAQPPEQPVKLIFIHHSCGENWLSDDDGGLGKALAENNYFVSDTNYGWGPDGIGDRTDITDWPEWFTGPDSGRYLDALYAESGQNAWYTRTLPDPGGENRIVMFKSCFPNSNMEGSPDDPPRRGDGLTVGNAKAIYNDLLDYFATRPDKLFVAITAPPVQDPEYSANARAFNTWLATEWLSGYDGNNVAVFDFYNVLTGPDNHHRVVDGEIEYVNDQGGDTLYYPSGDDHPSGEGNRKATGEFVPLLNYYVSIWLGSAPAPAAQPTIPAPTAEPIDQAELEQAEQPPVTGAVPPPLAESGNLIDVSGNENLAWDVFLDDTGETTLSCGLEDAVYGGSAGLHIEYDVAQDGWGSCSLVYPSAMNWQAANGLLASLHSSETGGRVVLVVYQGNSPDDLHHFETVIPLSQAMVDGWQQVNVSWDQLAPPSWEDQSASLDPTQVMGFGFLINGSDGRQQGSLDVAKVRLGGDEAIAEPTQSPTEEQQAAATQKPAAIPEATTAPVKKSPGLCSGASLIGLLAFIGMVRARRR